MASTHKCPPRVADVDCMPCSASVMSAMWKRTNASFGGQVRPSFWLLLALIVFAPQYVAVCQLVAIYTALHRPQQPGSLQCTWRTQLIQGHARSCPEVGRISPCPPICIWGSRAISRLCKRPKTAELSHISAWGCFGRLCGSWKQAEHGECASCRATLQCCPAGCSQWTERRQSLEGRMCCPPLSSPDEHRESPAL